MMAEHAFWGIVVVAQVLAFWLLTLTRTWYPRSGIMTGADAPLTGVAVVLLCLLVGLPWPWGIVPSVVVVAVSAWFAWSSRVPFMFRAWSYHRLTGDAYYTITDPPPTVWKRPRFIAAWWPDWL